MGGREGAENAPIKRQVQASAETAAP